MVVVVGVVVVALLGQNLIKAVYNKKLCLASVKIVDRNIKFSGLMWDYHKCKTLKETHPIEQSIDAEHQDMEVNWFQ